MKNNIKEIRVLRGLSQEVLANILNTTKVTVSRLENGKRKLSLDWIERISGALRCEPEDLYKEKNIQPTLALPTEDTSTYKSKRGEVFKALDMWDKWTPAQQDEFLAIALMNKKAAQIDTGGKEDNKRHKKKAGE